MVTLSICSWMVSFVFIPSNISNCKSVMSGSDFVNTFVLTSSALTDAMFER